MNDTDIKEIREFPMSPDRKILHIMRKKFLGVSFTLAVDQKG